MSVYKIFSNQSAVQTIAAIKNADSNVLAGQVNNYAQPKYSVGSTNPPAYATFVLTVSTPQPGVSVTGAAQPCGSNDGINWVTIGTPISVSSTPNSGSVATTTNSTFEYYSGFLSSGTTGAGAVAQLSVSS